MCNCQQQEVYNFLPLRNPTKRARGLAATGTQVAISAGSSGAGLLAGAIIGGPLGAAIGGGISILGSAISSLFTPDYTKIYASNDANETANLLQQNLNGWKALPSSSKVPAVQQFFIKNYETLWNGLVSYCSNPQLGTAGQKCISDREPTGPYPWNQYYLNPIQNDPSVTQQVSAVTFQDPLTGVNITVQPSSSSPVSSVASSLGLTEQELLLIGGGLVLLALL